MNVLIVKLTSMGDLVQALPALTDAHQAIPGIHFDWVVDEAFAEVPGWHPAVRNVIRTAHRRWRKTPGILGGGELPRFLKTLRATRYDAVIDAQTNLKSALVTALARGPKHGPDRSSVREKPAHWAYHHHYQLEQNQLAIDRWRQLFARVLGYPLPATAPGLASPCRAASISLSGTGHQCQLGEQILDRGTLEAIDCQGWNPGLPGAAHLGF